MAERERVLREVRIDPPPGEAHRRVQAVFSALASATTEDAQLR